LNFCPESRAEPLVWFDSFSLSSSSLVPLATLCGSKIRAVLRLTNAANEYFNATATKLQLGVDANRMAA
jgi:hypothetical protein